MPFLQLFASQNADFKLWVKGIFKTLCLSAKGVQMENKLKPREKLFCLFYCQSRSPRMAAANAGYGIFTAKAAARLICRTDIQAEIKRIDSAMPVTQNEIVSGCRTLAFGSAADAFSLIYSGDEELAKEKIEALNLMNISEIKRPKGGGIEIKFFDRLKALEKLYELSSAQSDGEAPFFYNAIEKSAAALREDFDAQ